MNNGARVTPSSAPAVSSPQAGSAIPAGPIPFVRLSAGRLAWAALALLAVFVVLTNANDVPGILSALRHADPFYLLAAAAFQAVFIVNLAFFYKSAFAVLGLEAPLGRFTLLGAGGYFVNLVSKTSGLGGMALYLNEGSSRGFKRGRTVTAYMITVILGHIAFFVTLSLAFALLYTSGRLRPAELAAAGVTTALLLAVLAVLAYIATDRRRLEAASGFVHRLGRRVRRLAGSPPDANGDSAEDLPGDLYEAVNDLRREPARYARPMAHALLVEILGVAVLFASARALGADISIAGAIAVYAVSVLFSMVSITPSGLGFVEASVTGFLVSLGVPLHHAVAASLAYRFFEFWVPLLIGALAVRTLTRQRATR